MREAAGIVVVPTTRRTVSVAWHWTDALGGIEIKVPQAQTAAAIAILSRFEPQYPRPRRLIRVIGFVMAFIALQIPPPSSGFFVVRRPQTGREAPPLPPLV